MAYERRDATHAAEGPGAGEATDVADPHGLLFGTDDREDAGFDGYGPPRGTRRQRQRRRVRRRRMLVLVSAVIVVLVGGVVAWSVIRPALSRTTVADWTGPGTGQVQVRVNPGDGTLAIAQTLAQAGVVRSAQAFTTAARDNPNVGNLQPGVYELRAQMSGAQALALMLDPASRRVVKLTIPEGTLERDVVAKLATALGVAPDQVQKAAADVGNLALPEGYSRNGAPPASAEGFLYPLTYSFDAGTSPTDALQQMTAQFIAGRK